MKELVQFLLESINTKMMSLDWFLNTLNGMQKVDPDTRVAFICKEAGISDYIESHELKKLKDAIQVYYDALDYFQTQMHAAKKTITNWQDGASVMADKYTNVAHAYDYAYDDVLCKLITKYKGGKVSESILEAKEDLDPMENAVELALQWKVKEAKDNDKEFADAGIFWAIVFALEDEGNAWAKTIYERVKDSRMSKRDPEKIVKEITGGDEFKMILAGISKIFDQINNLQEILDTSLEPIDDEDDPSEWKLSVSAQKLYDSELKKLEKMKKDFIDKCRAIK